MTRVPEYDLGVSTPPARKLPLTAKQAPIFLDELFFPDKPIAHNGDLVTIEGVIDPHIFADAIRRVVNETDTLRIRLSMEGDAIYQEVKDLPDHAIEQLDVSLPANP